MRTWKCAGPGRYRAQAGEQVAAPRGGKELVGCFGGGGSLRKAGVDLIQRLADPGDQAGIEGVVCPDGPGEVPCVDHGVGGPDGKGLLPGYPAQR